MRRLILALLAAIVAPLSLDAQPVPDSLLREVGQFAERYPNEVALCLSEDNFHVPETGQAVRSALRAAKCPDGTPVFWHSHPAQNLDKGRFRVFYRKHTGRWPKHAQDACYLSEMDVQSARQRERPWTIVQVDTETWCWWSLEQVEAIDPIQPMNPPPEGQGSWDG